MCYLSNKHFRSYRRSIERTKLPAGRPHTCTDPSVKSLSVSGGAFRAAGFRSSGDSSTSNSSGSSPSSIGSVETASLVRVTAAAACFICFALTRHTFFSSSVNSAHCLAKIERISRDGMCLPSPPPSTLRSTTAVACFMDS